VNRFAITMYDKRPTRWREVPRDRDDVFLPLLTPWPEFERSSDLMQTAYQALPPRWDEELEQKIFEIMFAVFAHVRHDAAELPAIKADCGRVPDGPPQPDVRGIRARARLAGVLPRRGHQRRCRRARA
jgi:hypothetical protein